MYSYIIYKIYSWTASKKGDTPIANTVFTLGTVHFFHIITLFLFIDRVITPLKWFHNIDAKYFYIGMPLYLTAFYFLLYNKERWSRYIAKYGNENDVQRKRGNLWVIAFLVGSVLLFFISLPVLFSINRNQP
jgi:hypothetical protein